MKTVCLPPAFVRSVFFAAALFWAMPCSRAASPSCTKGGIVFAAQFYRYSDHFYHDSYDNKPEETLTLVSQHLYRAQTKGKGGLTRLTFGDLVCKSPRWSPDGTKIVFVGSATPESIPHLYLINPDGSGRVRLTSGPWGGSEPQWSPDGKTIYFNGGGNLCCVRATRKNGPFGVWIVALIELLCCFLYV